MPIYEYHCCCCDRCFETLVLKANDPSPRCIHCGADQLERLLSSFACKVSTGAGQETTAAGCGSAGLS